MIQNSPSTTPWTVLGGPGEGAVTALAIGQDRQPVLYAGSGVGIFRSLRVEARARWERLPLAPLGVLCLAVSPNYAEDKTLVAGTHAGIYLSRNGGEAWLEARLPLSHPIILALAFSPAFASDGILLAGTLEDGVLYSDTRGDSWSNKSFGLLDGCIYSLVLSPGFERDGIAFAGAETTLYYSYNAARAWKELPFPADAAPILSLALSPAFPQDGTLYAGTETSGLFRSTNRGESWGKLGLAAASVSALLAPQPGSLLAATEAGVFASPDRGETWDLWLDQPDALCLAALDGLLLAGLAGRGAWMNHGRKWDPVAGLTTRTFVGLLLSPQFEQDGVGFIFGFQEGIWRTQDGGASWDCLNEALPGLEVQALTLSPGFPADQALAAATAEGVLLSEDAGESWRIVAEGPASHVVFSPDGKILAAAFPRAGVRASQDRGQTWKNVPGPWEAGGQVAALAVGSLGHVALAYLEGLGESASLWQGKPGEIEKILSRPVGGNTPISFWFPPGPSTGRSGYAGLGNTVWKLNARPGSPVAEAQVFQAGGGEILLALAGAEGAAGPVLFACTGRQLFRSSDGIDWKLAYDFGNERAVAFVPSPAYAEDREVYALLLGGTVCKGIVA